MTDSLPSGGEHRVLSRGLTGTLRGLLYAAAAASLGATLTTIREIDAFDTWVESGTAPALARLIEAEEASQGLLGVFSLVAMAVAVLTIVWWYQAYQAIERSPLGERSWSAGWAVGGWFIPFANLVIPKLVLNEIDRSSTALEEGVAEWRTRPLLAIANWWWAFWVLSSVATAMGAFIMQVQVEATTLDPSTYRSGLWMLAVGLATVTGAALCGAASIRVIGARLTRPRSPIRRPA
jgi:hypothetical protein